MSCPFGGRGAGFCSWYAVQIDLHPRRHPRKWSVTENVAWKTEVHGDGWSSPIVWGDRVFLTTTSPDGVSCRVLSFNRKSGELMWDKEVFRQTPGGKRGENSHATPTPATDGRLVYAVFSEGGFAAVRYDGSVAWTNRQYKHSASTASAPRRSSTMAC